jgi:glyoxylase-like metal-dependent hydrolase (beta-lactamase superfamily II)
MNIVTTDLKEIPGAPLMSKRLSQQTGSNALLAAAMVGVLVAGSSLAAQPARRAPPPTAAPAQRDFSAVQVRSMHVKGNIWVLQGAGGNVTVQIGDEGVLLVDTQYAQMGEKIIAEVRKLAGNKPLRFILNTHAHEDHIGGNYAVGKYGSKVFGGNERNDNPEGMKGATMIAHENVQFNLLKAEGTPQETAKENWPTEYYTGEKYEIYFNGEGIELLHQPKAHTDADTFVFFRSSDVVSAGDIWNADGYPYIDVSRGGHINGIIAGLNKLVDIAIPDINEEGGTMIIPGHGRVGDESEVFDYRDMITIIRDRIQTLVGKGMTLEQVKAARPTLDYDGRYGSTTGFWTTDMFIETVYKQLKEAASGGGGK